MKKFALLLAGLSCATISSLPAFAGDFYKLEKSTPLEGVSPGWDYVTLDQSRQLLFMGRREEGVTVFDIAAGKVKAEIANSKGANIALLIPELDRGYSANEDGSSTQFELSTLKTLNRIKVGDDADSAFYDPVTKQVIVTMGDSKSLGFVDAKSGKVLGKLKTESGKLDHTVPDGKGNVIVAERDRNALLLVDVKARKIVGEWQTTGCVQPTGLAIDNANHRLFVGCRSKAPVLLVMDSTNGNVVATLEIGRGNDDVVYDAEAKKIYAANGIDANLVIFDQLDADHYKLNQAVTTRPMARTMALDAKSKKVYLVCADGVADAGQKINTGVGPFYPNLYYDNSFQLLTYATVSLTPKAAAD